MPIHNSDIATTFEHLADLLEIKGDNPFRIRAYRNAARVVEDMPNALHDLVEREEDLTALDGIGKDLADKIKEMVTTGKVDALEKIKAELPPNITDLLTIQGLGPKRVRTLYKELQVDSLARLKAVAEAGTIKTLAGFGAKMETQILHALQEQADTPKRFLRGPLTSHVDAVVDHMKKLAGVRSVTVAGSYRRAMETIGDLDLLVIADDHTNVMSHFISFDETKDVLAQGETKSSVILRSGLQVDLRLVPAESAGAALHYFTGSKAHNIAMRKLAQQQGLKLNEYGLFDGDTSVAGATEKEIFQALSLAYIEPELRENRGEIEAARESRLPKLISAKDIKGNLHAHTDWSDGKNTLREMAEAARERGHVYLAITDHSKSLTVANGLNEDRVLEQIEQIDALNDETKGITILKGLEVDILEDGRLDLPDSVLSLLDVVAASVHSKFNLSMEQQTRRICRAMDNPLVTFIAHPTGRLLLTRKPYEVDVSALIEHAAKTGCYLEINANPQRLDLNDTYSQLAKEHGVMMTLNTDAHSVNGMDALDFGLGQARRAWLEARDVINTRSLPALKKLLRARR